MWLIIHDCYHPQKHQVLVGVFASLSVGIILLERIGDRAMVNLLSVVPFHVDSNELFFVLIVSKEVLVNCYRI